MWSVLFSQVFDTWLEAQEEGLQEKILADLLNLKTYGPSLSRPYADTVKGSKHPNMKELRVQYNGKPVRAFFAFDPIFTPKGTPSDEGGRGIWAGLKNP